MRFSQGRQEGSSCRNFRLMWRSKRNPNHLFRMLSMLFISSNKKNPWKKKTMNPADMYIYIYINTLSNEFPVGAKGSFTSSGSKISRFFASAKISWEDVMMGSWKSKNLPIATQQPPKKIEKWHEKTKITRGLVNFPDFWWSTVLSLGDFTWFHCKHQGLFAIVLQRFCNLTDLTIELQGTLSKSMNSCPDADGQHDPTLQLQFPKIAGKNLHTL